MEELQCLQTRRVIAMAANREWLWTYSQRSKLPLSRTKLVVGLRKCAHAHVMKLCKFLSNCLFLSCILYVDIVLHHLRHLFFSFFCQRLFNCLKLCFCFSYNKVLSCRKLGAILLLEKKGELFACSRLPQGFTSVEWKACSGLPSYAMVVRDLAYCREILSLQNLRHKQPTVLCTCAQGGSR